MSLLDHPAVADRRLAWSLAVAARNSEQERNRRLAAWRAACAARERVTRRAARAAARRGVLAVGCLAATLPAYGDAATAWGIAALLFAVRAGLAWRTSRRPVGAPAPPDLPPALPPPPSLRSAAFPPVRRLSSGGAAIRRLLLSAREAGPTARATADSAMTAAANCEQVLYQQASSVAGLEAARDGVGDPVALTALDATIHRLLALLEEGLAGYERLVAAAADLAAAAAAGPGSVGLAAARVQEATDALTGLAHGLRVVTEVERSTGAGAGAATT